MNKKEVAEIKKNFTDSSGFFTLNHIVSAYVDPHKNIRCKDNKLYALIPEDEGAVMLETLKKVLSGRVGKNLTEYAFPREEYEEDGAQNVLYAAVKGKLEDELANDKLIARIIDNIEYEMAYTLIMGYCTYSIMTKDESYDGDGDEYNFIVAAICPVCTEDYGLMFDGKAIAKKANADLIISRTPTDGFLFPVFSDRAPDVNNVMYYTKSPQKPNISIVEDVLGCNFVMSFQREKETFRQVLTDVAADELTALRFLFGYSYFAVDTDKWHMDFADVVIGAFAEMACAEKTKIQDGYVLGRTIIDRLNGLIKTSSLSDCIWEFEEKWEGIIAETKIKNPRSYLKSTLYNWLSDYKLEDLCYAF